MAFVGTGDASPGFLNGGIAPQHLLEGAFLSQGTQGCLPGPRSQNFLKWRLNAVAPEAFSQWGSSHGFSLSETLEPPQGACLQSPHWLFFHLK